MKAIMVICLFYFAYLLTGADMEVIKETLFATLMYVAAGIIALGFIKIIVGAAKG